MITGLTGRHRAVFLSGLGAGFFLTACSKGADQSGTGSASSNPNPAAADSAAPRADTTTTATRDTTPATATAASAAANPQQQSDSPPKPSIDPGRKNPKPVSVPKAVIRPQTDSSSAPGARAPADTGQVLKYDATSNTVTFELMAGPFNFNGFTNGAATLTVPPKANMVVNFVNKDGTPHSAEVISGEGAIPNSAADPAIPRAYTNKVLEGLPQEATDVMRFTVPESGSYRFFCGVPGHGLSGMWIWLKVSPAVKTPSFGPTKT